MIKTAATALVLCLMAVPAIAQAIVNLGSEFAAGAISSTDTFLICQSGPGGCPTGNTTQKTHAATMAQMATFIATQGFAMTASPSFTGTPTAPTAAQSVATNSGQVATVAFVKAQAQEEPTISWLVPVSPVVPPNLNGAVLLGRTAQAITIQALYCRPAVSGDTGLVIDVYYAPSGTGGASGTKINTTSCSPSGTVNVDQSLLSAPVNVPAQSTVYLVANQPLVTSAGSISAQITTQ